MMHSYYTYTSFHKSLVLACLYMYKKGQRKKDFGGLFIACLQIDAYDPIHDALLFC